MRTKFKAVIMSACCVLVVFSYQVEAQSDKRSMEFKIGPFQFESGTIYSPSKAQYQGEVEKQREAQMCLEGCRATREEIQEIQVGPYHRSTKTGKRSSHEEALSGQDFSTP